MIGIFPRAALSAALVATHRAGFGPQARVLDGARSDANAQLDRMRLKIVVGDPPPPDAVLIVVTAPGRTSIVSEMFQRLGADAVALARRQGGERRAPVKPPVSTPDIRIEDDTATAQV